MKFFTDFKPIILLICLIILFIISLIPVKSRKNNKIIKTIIISFTFLYLILITSTLYRTYDLDNLNPNINIINYILYVTGIILLSFAWYTSFISSIVKQRLISLSTSILFLMANTCFLINNINQTGLYSTSTIANILILIGCSIFFVTSIMNIEYLYLISVGWFIIIVARIIILISSYLYNNIPYYELIK